MDVITNEPTGLIDNPSEFHCVPLKGANKDVQDYLTAVLIENDKIEIHNTVSIEKKWEIICKDFCDQLRHIEAIDAPLIYFDTSKIWDHRKIHKIQSYLAHLLDYKTFLTVQKLYSWFKVIGL